MAITAIKEKVIVKNEKIETIPVVSINISADHRILDGHYVSQFLQSIKELIVIESPSLYLS